MFGLWNCTQCQFSLLLDSDVCFFFFVFCEQLMIVLRHWDWLCNDDYKNTWQNRISLDACCVCWRLICCQMTETTLQFISIDAIYFILPRKLFSILILLIGIVATKGQKRRHFTFPSKMDHIIPSINNSCDVVRHQFHSKI